MRVLAIPGGLRSGSNAAVLRALVEESPDGVEVVPFEGLADVELLDPELGEPPGASAFREAVVAADALVVVSPEYGHSLPGVLKNALDWLVQTGELSKKQVGVVTASPMPTGGLRSQTALVQTLLAQSALVPALLPIPAVKAKIGADGELAHGPTRRRLRETLVAVAEGFEEWGPADR